MLRSDAPAPFTEGAANWQIRLPAPFWAIAAVAASAAAAALQGALLPWVSVYLAQKPPDTYALTSRFFTGCASNANCMHVSNTLAFALLAACVAWIVLRNASGIKTAAFGAAIAAACSPAAAALIVHPYGAESLVTLIPFAFLAADAARALDVPLPLKCLALLVLVAQDATFAVSSLAYVALDVARTRSSKASLWMLASLLAGLLLSYALHGTASWMLVHPYDRSAIGPTLIAIAFVAFVIGPALLAVFNAGIPSRFAFSKASAGAYAIAASALLQGVLGAPNSPAEYWLAAEIAVLIGAVFLGSEGTKAAAIAVTCIAAAIVVQVFALAHRAPFLEIAGVPRSTQTLSAAFAQAADEHQPICMSVDNAASYPGRAAQTPYGRVTFVANPNDCTAQLNASSSIVTSDARGVIAWGSGGNALLQAVASARHAPPLHGGIGTPDAPQNHGAFVSEIPTPTTLAPGFIVQAAYSYRVACAWRGANRHLTFAVGNPLQAYPGAGKVEVNVVASADRHEHVLLARRLRPHAGPVSWTYYDVALPTTHNGCGSLTFTSTAVGAAIATWSAFAAPAVR